MQIALYNTIKPLYDQVSQNRQGMAMQTKSDDSNDISSTKTIQLALRLHVENNSKFVRGKKKVLEDIEICLEEYEDQKVGDKNYDYILTIEYETDEELDEIVYDIYDEMSSKADTRNCFIDADISTLDGERRW